MSSTSQELLCGTFGGICQVLVGQPFDTVKVRLQTGNQNAVQTITQIVKNEGPSGFYKGTLTPLLGAGVCVAIQFGALENYKRFMKTNEFTLPQLYLGGAFAGLSNSIISGPMEHVRTRLQVQSGPVKEYKGPYDFIKRIYAQYGISGLYKGQMITLARELHGYGIYFMVYEAMIQKAMKDRNIPRNQISPLRQLSYGAISGYILWTMIYPIDVVKTKIQTDAFDPAKQKYKGALDCFRKTWAESGYKGFYRGFGACMLRAGPANAVTFAGYEFAMNMMGR